MLDNEADGNKTVRIQWWRTVFLCVIRDFLVLWEPLSLGHHIFQGLNLTLSGKVWYLRGLEIEWIDLDRRKECGAWIFFREKHAHDFCVSF